MTTNYASKLTIRIYYEDTDAGGIVYYANYLKFLERARTHWLSELGFEQDVLLEQNCAFVVKQVEINYRQAAKFNEHITVHTSVSELKKASMVFAQRIYVDERLLVDASVKIACVDLEKMRPMAIPTRIFEELQRDH